MTDAEGTHARSTGQMQRALLGVARVAVIGGVVLSPWLFGSAEPWAYLSVCLLANVGAAAWLLSLIREPHPHVRCPALMVSLCAIIAFVAFQIMPLPRPLVRAASPSSERMQFARARVFEQTRLGEFLPPELDRDRQAATISTAPAATLRSLYLLTAYTNVFAVLAHVLKQWRHVRQAAAAIVISAFLMAVFALVQKFSGRQSIYWFHTPRFGGDIFGPFTNRNHFASHMNMAFAVTLGLLLALNSASAFRILPSWRHKAAWLSTSQGGRIAVLGFAAALMAAAVCVSLSRGAITSLAASLAVVGGASALGDGASRRSLAIASVALLTVAAVVWLGWQPVLDRLGALVQVARDPLSNARTVAALDTLCVFAAWPLFGSGFSSFEHVFPAFQSPAIQFGRWTHAHNDYVQLLAEGGVVGAGLLTLAACLFIGAMRRRVKTAPSEGRAMVAGLLVGIVAVAVHSLFDFSLHKPANALLLAALCGMCVSAVHLPGKLRRTRLRADESEPTEAEETARDGDGS